MNLFNYILDHRHEKITVLVNNKKIYSGAAMNFYNLRTKNPELYSNVSRHVNDFTLNETLNQFELKLTEPTIIAYLVYCPDRSYECEIRKCDKATKCSLYKQNMCMGANRLAVGCPELYKSVTKAGKNSNKGMILRNEYSEKQRNLPTVCDSFSGYFYEVDDRCYFRIPCIALYRGLSTNKIQTSSWFPGIDYSVRSFYLARKG